MNSPEYRHTETRLPEIGDFPGYVELMQHVEASSAVSFDFFDTLFIRPLANPEDAFDLIGLRYAMPDFRERRRLAQAEAFRRMHTAGRREITLEDIYACFAESKVSRSELMAAEYAIELSLIEPNPEIFGLFKHLQALGKPVAITSDMYLPADFFREALRPYDLYHVPLFISADCNATKRDSGDLFEIVAQGMGLPASKILHIGDNHLADVQRPQQKGMRAFHYRPSRERKVSKTASLATSIGFGLLGTRGKDIQPGSFAELGFVYGGTATVGFLEWIKEQARHDEIDHVLFLSRDGYALERVARVQADHGLPAFSYFLGSRTAFTLAAMTADNFRQFVPFLLSGGTGLTPCELLERIGVPAPSPKIMEDLGLGEDIRVTPALHDRLASFLFAYRWEILKVCRRNRRALYQYLRQLGLKGGSRVALVDVGWCGTTQEAFETAVKPLMDLDVYGYYFCLADTPERWRRSQTQRMSAMVTAGNTSKETISRIYANRVVVELFFSAPHHSVIGLQLGPDGVVVPVFDPGRGQIDELSLIAEEIVKGVERFTEHYDELKKCLCFFLTPLQTVWPMIELVSSEGVKTNGILKNINNFDAWGSSRNHKLVLTNYQS